MRDDLQPELQLALRAAADAGAAVMRHFGTHLHVTHKSPDQPLTAADLEADGLLREVLMGGTTGYGWLSEESADRPDRLRRERVWIVDPIDGTRSFIEARPEFAISIGLAERGAAVLGVVANPASGEVFWAVRGAGAWRRGADGVETRLQVRDADVASSILASRSEIAAGEFDALRADWRLLPTGSTAYKLALVAEGRGTAFLSRGPKSEWDVCAGALLVCEAGGAVTDLAGEELRYNRPDPYVHGILAGATGAHARLLQACEALPPGARLRRGSQEKG